MKRLVAAVLASTLVLTGCSEGEPPSATLEMTTQGANSATLSRDGRYAIVGAVAHGGALWDAQRQERLFDWNHSSLGYTTISESSFSPENQFAVTASPLDLVLWNTQSGQPVWYWKAPGEILDIYLTSNGSRALLGLANHEAVLFDIQNGGILQSLVHPGRVRTVDLSRDTRIAVTGSDDYVARVWNMQTGEVISQREFENTIDRVAISPNGNLVFSAATLSSAQIWNAQTGQLVSSLTGDETIWPRRVSYLAARFSNDGTRLLTGTASGLVQLWDVQTGSQLQRWRVATKEAYGPTQTSVYAVAFGPGSSISAIGSNGIWNLFTP